MVTRLICQCCGKRMGWGLWIPDLQFAYCGSCLFDIFEDLREEASTGKENEMSQSLIEDALDYAQVPFAYERLVLEYLRSHGLKPASENPPPCRICKEFGFYVSDDGIWHPCPKCNGHLEDQH